MRTFLIWAILIGVLHAPASAEVLEEVPMGPKQQDFHSIVATFRDKFVAARNDMAAGAARRQRAKAICTLLRDKTVRDWTGFITDLSSNGDGFGVLAIETGKGVQLKTWNNSFADSGDNTLLDPDGPVASVAVNLPVGQAVEFSGTFISDQVDCVRESSMTTRGSMTNPEFIFRFTRLRQLGDTYEAPKKSGGSFLKSLFD